MVSPARRFDEAHQCDVVGQRQVVELRVYHDVADVQLLVRQLLRRHADVVLAQPHLQHAADVARRQTVPVPEKTTTTTTKKHANIRTRSPRNDVPVARLDAFQCAVFVRMTHGFSRALVKQR